MIRRKQRNQHLLQKLYNREYDGSFVPGVIHMHNRAQKLFTTIPDRLMFHLQDVLQHMGNHVLMGTTRCGQFLVTYSYSLELERRWPVYPHSGIDQYRYRLHWWAFRPGGPAHKVAEVQLFDGHEIMNVLSIGIAQWPNINNKLIVYGHCWPEGVEEDIDMNDGVVHRKSLLTITTLPSLQDCVDCRMVAASFDEEDMAANWDSCVGLSCLKHSLTVHTEFDVAPPYPSFSFAVSLKVDNQIVINTGNFLHVLTVELDSRQTTKPTTPCCLHDTLKIVPAEINHRVGETLAKRSDGIYKIPWSHDPPPWSKGLALEEPAMQPHEYIKKAAFALPLKVDESERRVKGRGAAWCARIPKLAMKPVTNKTKVWRRTIMDKAEKVYAFSDADDRCEPKFKWYRRRRLADKMYEFCSDEEDMENIRPPNSCAAKLPRFHASVLRPVYKTYRNNNPLEMSLTTEENDEFLRPKPPDKILIVKPCMTDSLDHVLVRSSTFDESSDCSRSNRQLISERFHRAKSEGFEEHAVALRIEDRNLTKSCSCEFLSSLSFGTPTHVKDTIGLESLDPFERLRLSIVPLAKMSQTDSCKSKDDNLSTVLKLVMKGQENENSSETHIKSRLKVAGLIPTIKSDVQPNERLGEWSKRVAEACENVNSDNLKPTRSGSHIVCHSNNRRLNSSGLLSTDRVGGTLLAKASITDLDRNQDSNRQDSRQGLSLIIHNVDKRLLKQLTLNTENNFEMVDSVTRIVNQDLSAIIADWETPDSVSSLSPKSDFNVLTPSSECSGGETKNDTVQSFLEFLPSTSASTVRHPGGSRLVLKRKCYPGCSPRTSIATKEAVTVKPAPWKSRECAQRHNQDCQAASSGDSFPPLRIVLRPRNHIRPALEESKAALLKDCPKDEGKKDSGRVFRRQTISACSVQFERRYIEVDEEIISTITDIEDDDQGTGFHCSLPISVHGSAYSQLQMISDTKAGKLAVPIVLVRQSSLDIEQLCFKMADTICKCEGYKFWFCNDYDVEIVDVCPLNGDILIVVFMRFNAEKMGAAEDLNHKPRHDDRVLSIKVCQRYHHVANCRAQCDPNYIPRLKGKETRRKDPRHFYESRCVLTWGAEQQCCRLEAYSELKETRAAGEGATNRYWHPALAEAAVLHTAAPPIGLFDIQPHPPIRSFTHSLWSRNHILESSLEEIRDHSNLIGFRLRLDPDTV